MDAIIPYISLAGGLGVLILCGNWLVSGSVNIARYFKISTLAVGLTVVAFGTSAPELFVSIGAALKSAPDISVGNVIGSNIANIALVLGFTALLYPIPVQSRSILFDMLVMLFATVLLFFLGYNGIIGRTEGICLTVILAAYIFISYRKDKNNESAKEGVASEIKIWLAVIMVIAAIAGLYFGSGWFVDGARDIAALWGVSERVIGISVVALGTSMPELVTSVIAAIRKEADLSIGNIIGSNIFNIACVLGITSIIHPLAVANQSMFVNDMIWVFGIAVVLLLMMLPLSKGIIRRWKGGVLLTGFAAYIFLLYS